MIEDENEKTRIASMSDETLSTYRVIHTKRTSYLIPKTQEGIPVEEHFKNSDLPESLKGAKVYETKDGPVIVHTET